MQHPPQLSHCFPPAHCRETASAATRATRRRSHGIRRKSDDIWDSAKIHLYLHILTNISCCFLLLRFVDSSSFLTTELRIFWSFIYYHVPDHQQFKTGREDFQNLPADKIWWVVWAFAPCNQIKQNLAKCSLHLNSVNSSHWPQVKPQQQSLKSPKTLPAPRLLLLMEEILHQLIGSVSHDFQGFIHPRWCRISSINSMCIMYSATTTSTSVLDLLGSLRQQSATWQSVVPHSAPLEAGRRVSTCFDWVLG